MDSQNSLVVMVWCQNSLVVMDWCPVCLVWLLDRYSVLLIVLFFKIVEISHIFKTNTRHVCTYLNAFLMVISNMVTNFSQFWHFWKMCDIFLTCRLLPRASCKVLRAHLISMYTVDYTFSKYTVDYIHHLVIHYVLYSVRHLMSVWDLKYTHPSLS